MSIRGRPANVFSDNRTNLTAGERELREGLQRVIQQENIIPELAEKGITWRFIPPGAPNFGGAWERLVRSVKDALKLELGEKTVKETSYVQHWQLQLLSSTGAL